MKHKYMLFCCTVALSFCAGQLVAQKVDLKLPGSGLQAYHPIKKWRGLDLHSYLRGTELFGAFNTATGSGALASNTSGNNNTADGWSALSSNTTGVGNIAIGSQALENTTTGSSNIGIGGATGTSTGNYNIEIGFQALSDNLSGQNNIAIGTAALDINDNSSNNVAIGPQAMGNNVGGSQNTAVGSNALQVENGQGNIAVGYNAIGNLSSGSYLTAVGYNTLQNGSSENYSVALGYNALNNSGSSTGNNVATGPWSMYTNSAGYYNTASGAYALYYNSSGYYNTGSGLLAMYENTTGNFNLAEGAYALYENTTGSDNTALGYFSTVGSGALSNATALGADATVSSSNSAVIGSSAVTSIGGYANWTNFSDGRYKRNIQQNVPGLAFINKLNPITYTLDIDGIEAKLHASDKAPSGKNLPSRPSYLDDPVMKQAMQEKSAITYTGFVAQDVEKAADSVGFTFSGVDKPKDVNQSFYGLRYGDFVVPLVKAVQELSASSNSKDSAINALVGKYDSLQTQVNELRALLLAKNTTAMSGAALDQNSPNPFTGSTVIGYSLPNGTSSAKLQITDVSGNVLAIIPLSGSGGKSTLTASLSGRAAGTYMYSLIVNGKLVGTRQMIAER
jgi:trimeric autotransporter adhesin